MGRWQRACRLGCALAVAGSLAWGQGAWADELARKGRKESLPRPRGPRVPDKLPAAGGVPAVDLAR